VKQEWIVQVADPSGAAISDAKVALFAFDPKKHVQYPFADVPATHAHRASGRYEESAAIAAADGSFYIQDDGAAFHVHKDAQGRFTSPGPPILAQ
jgi:hypothetical protein